MILGFKQYPPRIGLAELNNDGSCYDHLGRVGFGFVGDIRLQIIFIKNGGNLKGLDHF